MGKGLRKGFFHRYTTLPNCCFTEILMPRGRTSLCVKPFKL